MLSWELSCDCQPDRSATSQVEVRFEPAGDGVTRVLLEHRGLETCGDRAEEMRGIFGSDGGWAGLLRRFAAAAA